MKLYVLRHGEAGNAMRDALRELTPRGAQHAARVGQWLAKGPGMPDTVWVSPLVRAQQTADAVFRQCGQPLTLNEEPLLVPDADPNVLLGKLESTSADLLLVGHNPLLSDLLGRLVGQRTPMLGTANLAVLEGDMIAAGCMRLLQVVTVDDAG